MKLLRTISIIIFIIFSCLSGTYSFAQNNQNGLWLSDIESVETYNQHEELAKHLREVHVNRLYIKVGDGEFKPEDYPEITNQEIVNYYIDNNIDTWAWSVLKLPSEENPDFNKNQAKLLFEAAKLGFSGYVVLLNDDFLGLKLELDKVLQAFTRAKQTAIDSTYITNDFPLYLAFNATSYNNKIQLSVANHYTDALMPIIKPEEMAEQLEFSVDKTNLFCRELGYNKPIFPILNFENIKTEILYDRINDFYKICGSQSSLWTVPKENSSDDTWQTIDSINWNKKHYEQFIADFPYFDQYNNIYETEHVSMVSSMAMLLKFYGAENINPDSIIVRNPDDMQNINTLEGWSKIFNKEAEYLQIEARDSSFDNGNIQKIRSLLRKKQAVAVEVDLVGQKQSVVLLGFDGTYYYANDPAGKWNQQIENAQYDSSTPQIGYYTKYLARRLEKAIGESGEIKTRTIKNLKRTNIPINDFETGFPVNWKVFAENGTVQDKLAWQLVSETPYEGNYAIKMNHYNTTSDCWLVTHQFTPGKNADYQISFFTRTTTNNYGSQIEIYISEDENQPQTSSAFISEPVAIFNEEDHGQFERKSVDLFKYAGKKIYLGFKVHNFGDPNDALAGGDNWWLDNIAGLYTKSENITPKIEAQQFAVDEFADKKTVIGKVEYFSQKIDFQTVTFEIIDGNISNAFAINDSTGMIIVQNSSAINYKENQRFELMVKISDIDNPNLSDAAMITINVNSSYRIESFEYTENNSLPLGWERFSDNEDLLPFETWVTTNSSSFKGSKSIEMNQYRSKSGCWLVSPKFTPTDTTALRFFAKTTLGNYGSYLKVFVSTATEQPSNRETFHEVPAIVIHEEKDDDYHDYAVDLSDYANNEVYVAFVVENFGDGNNWWLDYIDFYGEKIENTTPEMEAQTFSVEENSANGTIIGTVIANDYDIPEQNIRFSIISGNEKGLFGIESHSGNLFVANDKILDYESTPINEIMVRATDDGDGFYFVENIMTINLIDRDEVGIKDISVNKPILYPNPTKDYVLVKNHDYIKYHIYNDKGQLIETSNDKNKRINLTKYPNGLYFIKFFNKKNVKVVKIIKE